MASSSFKNWRLKADNIVQKNNLRIIPVAFAILLLMSFMDVSAFPNHWLTLLLFKTGSLALVSGLYLLYRTKAVNIYWFSAFSGIAMVSHNGLAMVYAHQENMLPISLRIFGFLLIASLLIFLKWRAAVLLLSLTLVSVSLGIIFSHHLSVRDWAGTGGPMIIIGLATSYGIFWFRMNNLFRQTKSKFELEESERLLGDQKADLEKLTQKLEKANEALELKIAMRTESLLKANQERDEMVYRLSHDFKTPMINVRSMMTMAKQSSDPNVTEEIYRRMEENLDRFEALVGDMESFVAYSNSQIEMNTFDLNELIQDIWRRLPTAQRGSLILECDPDIPSDVYSDRAKIDLVISTVVSNAAQYQNPDGNGLLSISGYWTGDEVELTFTDNGEGISEEVIARIFDLFYRGTVSSKGLGIGLYLARNTLAQLGGNIDINSPGLGQGSTVVLSFPG